MFSATMAFGKLHKFIFLVLMFLILTAGVYAEKESGFPLEDFWSLDAELGMSGILADGSSFQLVVDPKLWLSPTLMVGSRVGINYSVEDDTTNKGTDNPFNEVTETRGSLLVDSALGVTIPLTLSAMQSEVVSEQLRSRGVSNDQMVIISYGGTRTATSEWDVRNWNRRVEMIIINVDTAQ